MQTPKGTTEKLETMIRADDLIDLADQSQIIKAGDGSSDSDSSDVMIKLNDNQKKSDVSSVESAPSLQSSTNKKPKLGKDPVIAQALSDMMSWNGRPSSKPESKTQSKAPSNKSETSSYFEEKDSDDFGSS